MRPMPFGKSLLGLALALSLCSFWRRVEGGTGIGDFRLPIFPPWRADGHWKELPHHFFNRQSAIVNRQSTAPRSSEATAVFCASIASNVLEEGIRP
jgi:hypothetical protein